ncbi:MAG: hypothetical protein R6W69_11250 [Anaerolineales bacterium]
MEHQPFEDWLLNDTHLMPEERRDLNRHIASCEPCASLARANLILRAAPVARPANGFALRFQHRLEAERNIQRRRAVIGVVLLALVSVALIFWMLAPLLPFLSLSPAQVFVHWVSALVYLSAAAQAAGIVGEVIFRFVLGVLSPSVWLLLLVITIGLSALLAAPLRSQAKQKAYSRVRL